MRQRPPTTTRADSLVTYTTLVRSAGWIITAPVSNKQLYSVGFTHARQTEFIAERCGVAKSNAVMMLVGPSFRVVPITTPIALQEVPEAPSIDLITATALATAKGMHKSFALQVPRPVIADPKPHCGA